MVLVFMGQFGGNGGGRWFLAPLMFTLAPLLLPLLGTALSLLGLLFGLGGGSGTYVYDSATATWRRPGATYRPASNSGGSSSTAEDALSGTGLVTTVLSTLTTMVVTAAITVVLLKLFFAARRHGLRPTLRRLLVQGFWGGWDGPPGGGGQQQGRAQGLARSRSERIERVAHLMQSLPVEVYRTRQELERLSVAELKQLLKKRGLEPGQAPLEKAELVAVLCEGRNSTAASCSICCEDYASDDVLRVLRCGHRFHLECIDRWLLSSTDYSRPPACPMCNKALDAAGTWEPTGPESR